MDDTAPTAHNAASGVAALRRPTPRPGEPPLLRSRHTPSVVAISERRRAEFWRTAALIVCFSALLLTYLAIRAGRAVDFIHVMDPSGNMYAGPVEPMADSRRFFNVTAIYATNAALQRSPAGFDLSELLKLYYTPRAITKLEDDQKARAPDMRRRNLQWKPIIDVISDPVPAGDSRLVEVHGRVVVAGAFASRSFYSEPPFTLVMTFVRNPDLGKAGAYPWVCSEVELKLLTEPKS